MQISLMVDGKVLDQDTALKIVYDELGVLNGTALLANSLADGLHQENGTPDRAVLDSAGLREYIQMIVGQSMLGVYLRGALLLKQIEDADRKQQLGEYLVNCYPAAGYTPFEDSVKGIPSAATGKERLLASLRESEVFAKSAKALEMYLQELVEDDKAEGRFNSELDESGYKLVI